MVVIHIGPAVVKDTDPDQFGGIPMQALISMVHQWAQATDGSGAAVRVVLFMDHRPLTQKIYNLDISAMCGALGNIFSGPS